MRSSSIHFFVCACALTILLTAPSQSALAQSQASNGQIEGGVIAQNGSGVPGVRVAAINTGTSSARSVSTDENGMFRFPLLPLGNYRVTAEAPGFKKLVLEGVT